MGRDLYLRGLSGPADAKSASILPVLGLDYRVVYSGQVDMKSGEMHKICDDVGL
jgi:hypothetical protein